MARSQRAGSHPSCCLENWPHGILWSSYLYQTRWEMKVFQSCVCKEQQQLPSTFSISPRVYPGSCKPLLWHCPPLANSPWITADELHSRSPAPQTSAKHPLRTSIFLFSFYFLIFACIFLWLLFPRWKAMPFYPQNAESTKLTSSCCKAQKCLRRFNFVI